MVDIFRDIDGGDALKAGKNGDLTLLLTRLRERCYLNDESIAWIADRLEGKKEGHQKTGGKSDSAEDIKNHEMYFMYRWLVDTEKLNKKAAKMYLSELYGKKEDTIRKQIMKMEKKNPNKLLQYAMGIAGDREAFIKTKENEYRPIPLQKFGTQLSKK